MAYTVFESTNMKSTKYAERILDAISEVNVENGTFGYLTEIPEGEDVTYKFVAGVKAGETVVVVDQPAWDEDTSRITNQRKDKFIVKAGTRFRVRVVAAGDHFAISVDGITAATQAALKKDAFLTIDATGKLVAKAATTADAIMEAKVERVRIQGGTLATAANNWGYARKMFEAKVKTLA